MSLLELKNLKYSYDNLSKDLSFNLDVNNWIVNEGEFVSLIGPNGCGKSTLLKLIARLIKPANGRIQFSGIDIGEIPRNEYAKLVAYVPQTTFTLFPFSVYEIVMMGRTPYLGALGFESEKGREIVNDSLEMMEISGLKWKGINEISGGEAQRVFIARALAQKPRLLLLDEPNAHLDIEHQISIFELIIRLRSELNLTAISVTHDLNLVGIYSDKVAFMEEGNISLYGSRREVLSESNIRRFFNVESSVIYSEESDRANILINPLNQKSN